MQQVGATHLIGDEVIAVGKSLVVAFGQLLATHQREFLLAFLRLVCTGAFSAPDVADERVSVFFEDHACAGTERAGRGTVCELL